MDNIKGLLPKGQGESGHRKKSNPVDSKVFACVSMTARAVGSKMASKEMFKDIFMEIICQMLGGVELSPALTASLKELAIIIPESKKTIQDGLLNMLSQILMHKPLRHPGMPKNAMIAPSPASASHSTISEVGLH